MRNCIDEGRLQAWFDGELTADQAANVNAHLNLCVQCAEAARTIESENLIVAEGLATEFADAIPTDRLRQRLNAAVAALDHPGVMAVSQSRWRAALESFASFRLLAYAAIVLTVLFAGLFGLAYLKREKAPAAAEAQLNSKVLRPAIAANPGKQDRIATPPVQPNRETGRSFRARSRNRTYEPDAMSLAWQESQYRYAIARLNEAVKIQPPMRPALQVEYEYNLAVINSAIAMTRDAARKNPKDPQAAQFMLTAYQSKIDLLNEVATARTLEK